MKYFATIRIIIWTIVAVVCFSVFWVGLSGQSERFSFPDLSFGSWKVYGFGDSGNYIAGGGNVAARDIQSVEINWIAGRVDIVSYDGDVIQFNEEGYSGDDEKYAMRYLVKNGKLFIRFCAPQRGNRRFLQRYQKTLTVNLPRDLALRDFQLNAVSADIHMESVRADDLDISSVSGFIDIKEINVDNLVLKNVSGHINTVDISASTLRANTVSGRIDVMANVENAKFNTVSGSVKLYAGDNVRNINVNTISGGIILGFPENDGFTAQYSSVSGRFDCEFPIEMSGKRATYANGNRDISLNTVSGGMRIVRRSF